MMEGASSWQAFFSRKPTTPKPTEETSTLGSLPLTVTRKYLRSGEVERKFNLPDRPSKLDASADKLSSWVKLEANKSRKQKHTTKQLHTDLLAQSCDGFYGRVAALARDWKAALQQEQQTSGRGTFVSLVFHSGEAFQFDWSEEWAILGGSGRSRKFLRLSCRIVGRLTFAPIFSRPTRSSLTLTITPFG